MNLAPTSLRVLLLALLGVASCLLMPSHGKAQEVIGVSAILATTDATHIDTYSATEMDSATAFYYDALVEGYLFQNNALVYEFCSGCSLQNPQNPIAEGKITGPLTLGDTYEIDSYHYLIEYFVYYDGTYSYYSNPLYYLDFTGSTTDPSNSGFTSGGGPGYYTVQTIELGITAVAIQTGVPSITSINPSSGTVGSSGTITVQGSNLTDIFTSPQSTTPNVTGSGMSLSVQSVGPPPPGPIVVGASQVTLAYTIAQNASTGAHNITLSNHFGTSNAVAFNVGDPTPVITSVTPNVWQAGNSISVTITGSGFGTNPTLTLSGSGVSVQSITSAMDTQIVANVSVSRQAPSESVTVQVQSNGYGNGFIATTPGQSQSGSNTVSVLSIPAPAALIMQGPNSQGATICQNGTNIASSTQPVYIGQQIGFSGCVPQSVADLVISESWQPTPPSSGIAVANFSVSSSTQGYKEIITQVTQTNCGTIQNCDFNPFYWIQTGSYTFSFTYLLINGNSNSAYVTYNVSGPTPTGTNGGYFTATPTPNSVNVWPANVAFGGNKYPNPSLEFGNVNPIQGIIFQVTAQAPSKNGGAFQWVQLIGPVTQKYLANPAAPDAVTNVGLDNWYPYVTASGNPDTTNDSPGMELAARQKGVQIPMGEGAESFQARMHLMWDPALPTGCTPASTTQDPTTQAITSTSSTCTGSIPVPLGYADWGFQGDAINTLVNQTSTNTPWLLNFGAPKPSAPAAVSSNSYPQWGTVILNK